MRSLRGEGLTSCIPDRSCILCVASARRASLVPHHGTRPALVAGQFLPLEARNQPRPGLPHPFDDLLQRGEFDPISTPRAGSISANRQNSRCRVLSTTDATSLLAPARPNALRFKLMILHNQRQVDLVESLVGNI